MPTRLVPSLNELKGGPAKDEATPEPRGPNSVAAQGHARPNPLWEQLATRPQARLEVTDPADPSEREADGAAEEALRTAGEKCACGGSCEKCRPAQRKAEGLSATPTTEAEGAAPPSPAFVLDGKTGRPLDRETGEFFGPRFGQDFSDVRVHTDSRAAASAESARAHAYTLGSDIVFGAGEYSPGTTRGRSLLAHELAHVVQQRGAGRPTLARQPWGTAKTTAPPARNEDAPGSVFRARLKDELALFANAGAILDWIVARHAAGGASATSFKTSDLFADAAAMKKLTPVPKSQADLTPALQMLEYYKVISAAGTDEWKVELAPPAQGQTQQEVNRASFDKNRKDIAAFQKGFEKRFNKEGHPIAQIAQKELLEDSLAAGSGEEWKTQHDAEKGLAAAKAELEEFVAFPRKGPPVFRVTTDSPARATVKGKTYVMLSIAGQKKPTPVEEANFDRIEPVKTGTSAEVVKRRAGIESRVKSGERALFQAQDFHRFAVELVWFLHELEQTSGIKFKAGTYPRHGRFGEYAADVYPSIAEDARGFYKIDKAEQFVDDINKVAETGNKYWGKFAWRIIYNDEDLQKKINAKYGTRMSSAPHHGPAPDKLHMHLDVRPLDLVADHDTGFGINRSGRVELY